VLALGALSGLMSAGAFWFWKVCSAFAGLITFVLPAIKALGLSLIVAVWVIVTCVFKIIAAVRLRRYIRGKWPLMPGGITSVVFGTLLS
jgi:uncharacterized membrane protein HdeD (DUF308 family)